MEHSTDDAAAAEPSPHFHAAVGDVLMAGEELRRIVRDKPAAEQVVEWRYRLDHLLAPLDAVARGADDAVEGLEQDLFRNCQYKAMAVAQHVFKAATTMVESEDDGEELRQQGQASVARVAEVNLLLLENARTRGMDLPSDMYLDTASIIDAYVAYQRQVLRQRAKPCIARLVAARPSMTEMQPTLRSSLVARMKEHTDVDDDEEENAPSPALTQYHAPVLAEILGSAASLIHPLLAWQVHLPPVEDGMIGYLRRLCQGSIKVVDDQAQTLIRTVSEWFYEDRPVDDWMRQSAEGTKVGEADQLGILDALVEEMAFGCQVQARYQALIASTDGHATLIEKELLPEWTWKYAALERFLAMQQWQSALALAAPVHIVMGTEIQVPSVVEDAQYLSTRALERAASTLSPTAVGTVAHAMSHDVWSTEMTEGVHQALLERRGCWSEPPEEDNKAESTTSPPKSGFASALLDALDEDLKTAPPAPHTPAARNATAPTSAPSSGGFLTQIVGGSDKMQQMQLDTEFCVLNGLDAASGACRSLVAILDSLLSPEDDEEAPMELDDKALAMTQLAREELDRFANAYQSTLKQYIQESLTAHCGSGAESVSYRSSSALVLESLRYFFDHEDYQLDAQMAAAAESEERLQREMMEPLANARFLNQLTAKCEANVLRHVGEAVVGRVVELILKALWSSDGKFTEWGALLLAKEVRMLQGYIAKILTPDAAELSAANLLPHWERLSQVLTVLQLEKPSDWLAYHSTLSPDDLSSTLSLRVDFSSDAIAAVVAQIRKANQTRES